MRLLLALSQLIDRLNLAVGKATMWVTLIVVFISAGNATIRKLFNVSSNAWLELQWYLFGVIFLLAAGYTLLKNEHVRVDILSTRFSRRKQVYIEIFGILFMLLPMSGLILVLSWTMFMESFVHAEMSSNPVGLIRWPAKLIIPVGFTLLILAALSHLIKCIGYLRGLCPDPRETTHGPSAEEKLALEIAQESQAREAARIGAEK